MDTCAITKNVNNFKKDVLKITKSELYNIIYVYNTVKQFLWI